MTNSYVVHQKQNGNRSRKQKKSHSVNELLVENSLFIFQEKTLPFPDITVCNLNSIAAYPKDRVLYEKYLQEVMKVIKFGNCTAKFRIFTTDDANLINGSVTFKLCSKK